MKTVYIEKGRSQVLRSWFDAVITLGNPKKQVPQVKQKILKTEEEIVKMAYKVPKFPVCGAIACCVVALIFQLASVAGTGWLVFSFGGRSVEMGLFRSCRDGVCTDEQSSTEPDWLKACQAFSILGLLTIAGSLVLGILHAVLEDTVKVSLAGIASCAASVVFLIIELAMFGPETSLYRQGGLSFGYGFILSIIACILSFVAAVLFAVGSRM